MTWYKADETKRKINEMLAADQGATYRGWLGKVLPHIGDAYREGNEPFRPHMGASLIGNPCARAVWYSFRWATRKSFDGRMIRLFNRGHLEEGRFIAMLLGIGVKVFQQDANGKQFRITGAFGHYGGSGDGIGFEIPDLTADMPAVLEFKTSSDKIFVSMTLDGVRKTKWEHYVQMQQYMLRMNYSVALYMMVNKNNDEIHCEIVPFDREVAEQFFDRGERLVFFPQPPIRISERPTGYECRYCDHKPLCHGNTAPDRNCRTCKYSEPTTAGGGQWICHKHNIAIALETQYNGCSEYREHESIRK